ncbi:Putative N-acetyl-LL-diaminopimelate aminotransferase [Planctomycetes bacterium Pan216]|uniref:Aminotransferase n=1 Tax=Kolteria novifilia TaxID=2527975 RepID=A0A518B8V0_9BACT|nr:Putative N-acetyl-LL-diaminopimelate aminotransferase [Planctomycetes bacterium Pan216]
MQPSSFAQRIAPSATMAAGAKARELKSAGIEVFDFSLGEPDFTTPAHICDAATKAMADGQTHYTPASGTAEVKKAIADYHRQWHQLDYKPENICVSSGAKHTIYSALCATLEPGDEVLIPAPFWVSYAELVKMTGAVPVIIETTAAARFKASVDQLRAACTPKSKMLMLNSPSNPTGMAYAPAELESIAELANEKDLIVLSDEIYERLLYGDAEFKAFASLGPDVLERTLTVNGVSKTYAMTGWRIGWTAGPAAVIKAMGTIQSQQTSNPCSISQCAAIAALSGDQAPVEAMKKEFAKRRDFVCKRLGEIEGLGIVEPDGAFYAFIDVSAHFGKTFGGSTVKDSSSFCLAALEQAHVNLVQGDAFGAEGFARLSFATSMEIIAKGLDALEAWLKTGS